MFDISLESFYIKCNIYFQVEKTRRKKQKELRHFYQLKLERKNRNIKKNLQIKIFSKRLTNISEKATIGDF